LPVAWHNSTWVGNRTIDYLRAHRQEPFCLWASFPDPHQPFDAPAPWCYRVALLVEGPGVPAGQCIGDPVSTLDLAPTLCDDAGSELPVPVHGRSLRGLIESGHPQRDFARSEWHLRPSRSGVELQLQTVRTRRHKLTVEQISGAGELYDLQEDPGEMHNGFDDPAYAAVRRELLDMIAERPAD
jgi:arylsulfatase A-like enzyme